MKKLLLVSIVVGATNLGFSQEANNSQQANKVTVYSVFVNVVNEPFRFPLIGFVNVGIGNHKSPQIGLANVNTGSFSGSQTSLVNVVGGDFNGAQISLANIASKEIKGVQVGLLNVAKRSTRGVQIGLLNYVDSAESVIPIGLLSIVRQGGYHAIEYSFSEFYPINVGYKIGVEKFYSTLYLAYNPFDEISKNRFAWGLGIGSIIPITNSFFFNPELNSISATGKNTNSLLSIVTSFGYKFSDKLSITAGPSVTWIGRSDSETFQEPFFTIINNEIDKDNSIVVGLRFGLRYRF
jgi:hypothetical protein